MINDQELIQPLTEIANMKPICMDCRHFKRSGIRAEDQCGHPQLVTVEVHNEIYGGVTCPEIARARRQCNGLKFEPKLPWIKRILQARQDTKDYLLAQRREFKGK